MTRGLLKKRVEATELKVKSVEAMLCETRGPLKESHKIKLMSVQERIRALYRKIQNTLISEETIQFVNELCQREENMVEDLILEMDLI
jgi:hypothetical protein